MVDDLPELAVLQRLRIGVLGEGQVLPVLPVAFEELALGRNLDIARVEPLVEDEDRGGLRRHAVLAARLEDDLEEPELTRLSLRRSIRADRDRPDEIGREEHEIVLAEGLADLGGEDRKSVV